MLGLLFLGILGWLERTAANSLRQRTISDKAASSNLDLTFDCYEHDIDCSVNGWEIMTDEDQAGIQT